MIPCFLKIPACCPSSGAAKFQGPRSSMTILSWSSAAAFAVGPNNAIVAATRQPIFAMCCTDCSRVVMLRGTFGQYHRVLRLCCRSWVGSVGEEPDGQYSHTI